MARKIAFDPQFVASRVLVVCMLSVVALTGCSKRAVDHSLVDSLPVTDPLIVNDAEVNPARLDSLLQLLTVGAPIDTVSTFVVPLVADTLLVTIPIPGSLPGSTPGNNDGFAESTIDTSATVSIEPEAPAPVVYDIPIDLNVNVLAWVDSYSGNQKAWFGRALTRAGQWLPMIRRIFREEGLPDDLAYLALVESGYRHNARSRVSAIGMWQFMRGTARDFDLQVDSSIDERLDPELSTRAAARYLKKLHAKFGDWRLAMGAYNTGAGNMRKAIRRSGSRDFWEISRKKKLARETRNFVPAIMAATILAREPEKFGFDHIVPNSPIEYEWVEVTSPTHVDVIARCSDVPAAVIRDLNPALIARHTPHSKKPYAVKVPVGTASSFDAALASIPQSERMLNVKHRVNRGESLSVLASRYGTSVRAIQDANRLGRNTKIRAGATLTIPTGSGGGASHPTTVSHEPVTHRVQSGETLSHVAQKYSTTISALQRENNIRNANGIRAGQRLRVVPGSGAAVAAPASRTLTHRVRSGESLWTIARKYDTTIKNLRAANPDLSGTVIRIGQKLTVPGSTSGSREEPFVHRVRAGENLWDIARTYQTSIANLRAWNGLDAKQSIIRPGDRLKVYR